MRFSPMLLPWETFKEQAERERREEETGVRWTEELLAEVRAHILDYSAQLTGEYQHDMLPKHCLHEVWRSLPHHYRKELFEGVSCPLTK